MMYLMIARVGGKVKGFLNLFLRCTCIFLHMAIQRRLAQIARREDGKRQACNYGGEDESLRRQL